MMQDYLAPLAESMPKWLAQYEAGSKAPSWGFSDSRVVYYPGGEFDDQPIQTFGLTRYAHVFIYADYGVNEDDLISKLQEGIFRGYHVFDICPITGNDLIPVDWYQHIDINPEKIRDNPIVQREARYTLVILDPDPQMVILGAERIALIYLYADGITAYDALFGNYNCRLDLLVLQDHGFGGNYDRFGRGGYMQRIAMRSRLFPALILCDKDNNVWPGYEKIDSVDPVIGGMHRNTRWLWRKKSWTTLPARNC